MSSFFQSTKKDPSREVPFMIIDDFYLGRNDKKEGLCLSAFALFCDLHFGLESQSMTCTAACNFRWVHCIKTFVVSLQN